MFKDDIEKCLKILSDGGVILYPTDTVWGIGCDATNPEAVAKVYEIKERVNSKAMLSIVDSEAALERWVNDIPEITWELLDAAVDPMTVIYDHPHGIAPNLLAEDGSAAFRISKERFSSELARRFRRPIVSTSANIAGEKSPATFNDISDRIIEAVDYVVEFGRDYPPSRPSNIIKVSDGGVIKIIR